MTKIIVFINGDKVLGASGQDVYQNSILKLIKICGEEQVLNADVNGNNVSTEGLRREVLPKPVGKYHFSTNHGNPKKVELLEKLSNRLGASLKAELIEL